MIKTLYNFLLTIPDRLYMFPSVINGEKQYFLPSYNHTKMLCKEFAGSGYCRKLLLWRELFHVLGALCCIGVAIGLEKLFHSKIPASLFLGTVIAWITFQEWYLHPTFYDQTLIKGLIDWLVWVVPIALYFILKR